jgi:hypothetical protein
MNLATYLHLVQRLEVHGPLPPLPYTLLWYIKNNFTFSFLTSSDLIAGVILSIEGLATGWTIGVQSFNSKWGLGIFLFHHVQISSEAHPASYPMDTRGSFPIGKAASA